MKTALITGASSGIGYELAKIYAKNGYNLVLIARRFEQLQAIKDELLRQNFDIDIHIFEIDLSNANTLDILESKLNLNNIQIDVLINNAGFGLYGKFDKLNDEQMNKTMALIDTNIKALVALTRFFSGKMRERRSGEILNVASVASFCPGGPFMAVYYASKSFVLSFTNAIREEMNGSGVKISVLCPGPTDTEFEKLSNLDKSKIFRRLKTMSAEDVAKIAFYEFQRGKSVIVPGLINKILVLCTKIFPHKLSILIIKFLQSPMN